MPTKLGNGGHSLEEYNSDTGKYSADGKPNKYYDNPSEKTGGEANGTEHNEQETKHANTQELSDKEQKYIINNMKDWFGIDYESETDYYLPEYGFDGDLMLEAYMLADEENGFDNTWGETEVWETVEGKYNELFEKKYPNGMPTNEDEEREKASQLWGMDFDKK